MDLQPSKTTPINRATDTHHPHEQPARVLQLGLAVLSTLADSHTASQLASGASRLGALASGYQLAFGLAAAICFAGTLLSVVLLRPDPSDVATVAGGREARWAAWTCGRIDAPRKPPDTMAPDPS